VTNLGINAAADGQCERSVGSSAPAEVPAAEEHMANGETRAGNDTCGPNRNVCTEESTPEIEP